MVRGERELSPEEIVEYVYNYRNEYITSQSRDSRGVGSNFISRSRVRPKWSNPPPGWLKINYDAVLDLQSGRAGVGVICKNETVMCSFEEIC